jgi:hypothetical protein
MRIWKVRVNGLGREHALLTSNTEIESIIHIGRFELFAPKRQGRKGTYSHHSTRGRGATEASSAVEAAGLLPTAHSHTRVLDLGSACGEGVRVRTRHQS